MACAQLLHRQVTPWCQQPKAPAMNIEYHPHRSKGPPAKILKPLTAVWIILCLTTLQCNEPPLESTQTHRAAPQPVVYDDSSILLFPTAEEQLNYAQQFPSDSRKRRAALEVLIQNFDTPTSIRAEAELELAYWTLGADHRFAGEEACRMALDKYRRIIAHYPDLAAVCAKAHWYMGWIYADLLKRKPAAIEHYQTIVQHYPETRLNLEPPVPWVSLVLPQTRNQIPTAYERPTYRWGSIALLEIIRNSDLEEEKWQAFETLWSDYNTSLAMGYALRDLLHGPPPLYDKAVGYAESYLAAKHLSRPLAEDIKTALQTLTRAGDSPAEQKRQSIK